MPGIPCQLQRYGIAVLAVAQALLLTLLLDPQLKQQISPLLFVVVVMVSAGYGGLGPGLLATCLTTLATAYLLISPTFTLVTSWDKPLWLVAFGLVCLLVGVLAAAHRQAEERLRARVRQQVAVAELGQQALSSSDLSRLMDHAASLVAQTLEVEYCQILELLPDDETLLLRAGVGWQVGLVGQMKVETKTGSHAGYTLLSKEPVIIEDWRTEKRFNLPPLHHDHRITSGISVIIDGHNPPFGVLGAYATKQRAFTQDQVYFLQAIANILAEVVERKQGEEALRKSEERYRAFVQQSSEGIWRFELEEPLSAESSEEEQIRHFYQYGYLAECNDAMAQMYGFDCAAELVGTRLNDLLVRSGPENHAYLSRFIRSGYRLTDAESYEVDQQGHPKYFLNNFVGMVEDGVLARAWGSQRDITTRKRLEEALRQQAAELAQANRMKDEFLAIVSHELRSPLNAILGWAGLLRTRKYDEMTTARALETIERNAKSQTQLIDDLLDVSQIIRGKLRLNVRSVNPVPVIEAAIDTVRPAAEAKAIQLESRLNPLAGNVLGDIDRLQQVIWNLLSNAIKFTPEGGRVEIQLDCINSHVQIRVSDTGQGISADLLPYIFERFRQADSTTTRSHGGLGLGLAIVRQLVELHGGTVQAESPGVGKGATFIVTLPLKAARDGVSSGIDSANGSKQPGLMLEGEATCDSSASLNGLQVLVVDDEAEVRALVTMVLEQHGSKVTVAASVDEALAALEHLQPDVLLCDIGMPGKDGYALIRKVRELESKQGRQIPAAALTAYVRAEDRTRALLAGFQIHLPKPVEPSKLVMTVANLARRSG
jgi:PAS domain S-box-containing protein